MNNKRNIFIFFMFFALFCGACKNKAVEYYEFKITNDSIQPKSNGVEVSGAYSYGDEVNGIDFSYGLDKELVDAISKPMELEGFEFSVSIDSLTPNTWYYYCYKVDFGISKFYRTEIDSFLTLNGQPITPEPSIVITLDTTDVTDSSAVCWGRVVEGTCRINEWGICWSMRNYPTIFDNHASSSDNPDFSVRIDSLLPNQAYYYRAYALSVQDTVYGEVKSFVTKPSADIYTIAVSANNDEWGRVVGGGEFGHGETCTVKASANENCKFDKWTEGGNFVSDNTLYAFPVVANRQLVANFISVPKVETKLIDNITINAAGSGGVVTDDGGAVVTQRGICWSTTDNPTIDGPHADNGSGTGSFDCTISGLAPNTTYYVRAYAINSVGVGYGSRRSFTTSPYTPPVGIINGRFTVGDGKAVYFSEGNLQYQASTNTWRIAENTWDVLGGGNNSISSTYDGWIDLFGWGTSGYNHNNACYQPWATNQTNSRYYAYDDSGKNLYDVDGRADWGYNAIKNGGNTENRGWRTLTKEEWNYVLNIRESNNTIDGISDARYAKATVNGKAGVILFPDNFIKPNNVNILGTIINQPLIAFNNNNNTYGSVAWNLLKENGCVFLPVSGSRSGTSYNDEDKGYYWSSSSGNNTSSFGLSFDSNSVNPSYTPNRSKGMSVRLVCPVE